MSRRTAVLVVAALLVGGGAVVGCSSSSVTAPEATGSSPSTAASEGGQMPGTEAMRALCDRMVSDNLTSKDATALAEANGYVARVGVIDGVPQAVTMDFREDRFTFDVTEGVVTACTYG